MSTPYTYLLKCLPTNEFYYGVKYGTDADPSTFWTNYFTSSKEVKKLIEEYGINSFEYEIRKTFSDAKLAREWERKVLMRMNVVYRDDFINRSVPGVNFGFDVGDHNPMKNPEVVKINHAKRNATLKLKYEEGHNWKTKEHSEAASKRAKERNSKMNAKRNAEFSKIIVECPHCGRVGKQPGMSSYHLDKCKKKGI